MSAKDDEDEGGGGPIIIDPKSLKKWVRDYWKEIAWAVGIFVLIVAGRQYLPILDPRIGFDGFSDLLYAGVAAFKMVLVVAGSWASYASLHVPLDDEQEAALLKTGTLAPVILDRASLFVWAALWFAALFVF